MYSKRTQGKGGCLFVIACTQRDFRCALQNKKGGGFNNCVYSINNDGRHIPIIKDCVSMHPKQLDVLSAKAVNVRTREREREREREFSLIYTGTVMIVLFICS